MNFKSQKQKPSKESLVVVDRCAKKLKPQDKDLLNWHNDYVSNHKARVALDLDVAKEQFEIQSEVLEFGSVPFLFTTALSECNYDVTGVDIAPERYQKVVDSIGINVYKCDIENEKLPFDNELFDAIVFNELFEHLRVDLIFTFSEVFRVLKPGGKITLSTPNLKSLGGLLNLVLNNRSFSCCGNIYTEYSKLKKLGHMGHVREYTTTEIIEFLTEIGFEVTDVIYRGRFRRRLMRIVTFIIPRLRPYVSYVAIKNK